MSLLHQSFTKGDDLITRIIAGETLIVPVRNRVGDLDSIYTLNELASYVWHLIDGQMTTTEIVETIRAEYDVTGEEATRDVLELIDSLQTAGLIRPTNIEEQV
jgi:hypothetical protein